MNPFFADVLLDMGTARTRMSLKGGARLEEPTVVAYRDGLPAAAGEDALKLAAADPAAVKLVRPVEGGAVADMASAADLLRLFMRKLPGTKLRLWRRAYAALPGSLSDLERRAVEQTLKDAGAAEVISVDAGKAAALGCALPIGQPRGCMVMDIGAGKTGVSVWSMGGSIAAEARAVGAGNWLRALTGYMKNEHRVMIREDTASELLTLLADVYAPVPDESHPVRGRDRVTGLPVTLSVTAEEIRHAMEDPLAEMAEILAAAFSRTPPELAADIMNDGLTLCGGGSCLRGLPERLEARLNLPVRRAEAPENAVMRGLTALAGK